MSVWSITLSRAWSFYRKEGTAVEMTGLVFFFGISVCGGTGLLFEQPRPPETIFFSLFFLALACAAAFFILYRLPQRIHELENPVPLEVWIQEPPPAEFPIKPTLAAMAIAVVLMVLIECLI